MKRIRSLFILSLLLGVSLAFAANSCAQKKKQGESSSADAQFISQNQKETSQKESSQKTAEIYKFRLANPNPSVNEHNEVTVDGVIDVTEIGIPTIHVEVKKEGKIWSYDIPIADSKFIGKIALNGGKGKYTLTFSVFTPHGSEVLQQITVEAQK